MTSVAAYAAAGAAIRSDQPRRLGGYTTRSVAAAMAQRKLATCQGVKSFPLIAAPPGEKRTAAIRICSLGHARPCGSGFDEANPDSVPHGANRFVNAELIVDSA